MKIIPDKFILLNIDNSTTIEKVKKNLMNEENVVQYEHSKIN